MTCANCAQNISRMLEKKGVKNAHVDFSSGEVEFENGKVGLSEIVNGINRLGYKVIGKENASHHVHHHPNLEIRFFISLFFTIPLLLHMIPGMGILHEPVLQLILCMPVMFIGWNYFGKSAWGSLRAMDPNMDVLIVLGSTMAFLYSIAGMILFSGTEEVHRYLFFETAATIITFVLLGNIIEKRSLKKTVSALEELSKLQPLKARRINDWGTSRENISEISSKEIRPNDLLVVNTGDQVPADGKIFEGEASMDESMLTGESAPAEKALNDAVFAGAYVLKGTIKIFVEKAGSQTVLSNVIELVRKAQSSKPKIQKLGDKVSSVFVPSVIVIALITFLANHFLMDVSAAGSLMRAVAVLVIACPCAMGLATPTAVSAGVGRAARNGILIRGGDVLEIFSKAKTVVFDKTGTLTTGNLKISNAEFFGNNPAEMKKLVYHLEKFSTHPVAAALIKAFENEISRESNYSFQKVEEEKGFGMKAISRNGDEILLGSWAMAKEFTDEKNFSVYLIINKKPAAAFGLDDEIRKDAREVIQFLNKKNIRTVLLSGDREDKCKAVAAQTGIEKVFFEKLPHEKTQIIESLKKDGAVVMVGDGINDAPSLAAADAGVSFGNASAIAVNSAQIILMNSDELMSMVKAYKTGKATFATIRQNLFWAFFYNVLAIPVAAAGFLSPIVASLSMAFSDVIVIGNSIRLKYRKI